MPPLNPCASRVRPASEGAREATARGRNREQGQTALCPCDAHRRMRAQRPPHGGETGSSTAPGVVVEGNVYGPKIMISSSLIAGPSFRAFSGSCHLGSLRLAPPPRFIFFGASTLPFLSFTSTVNS